MKREVFPNVINKFYEQSVFKTSLNGVIMWLILKFQWLWNDAYVNYVCLFYVACQGKYKQGTPVYIKWEIIEDEHAAHVSVYCDWLDTKFSYFGETTNWVHLEWGMGCTTGVILQFLCFLSLSLSLYIYRVSQEERT